MDDQEPTAWEDINPTTALAARPEPRSMSLAPWQDDRALKPATEHDFRRELTACLALVGSVGMSTEDRREWLLAAWGTLRDIPADLLERGCNAARRVADHPAKIVPAIMAEVEQAWKWRREHTHRPDEPAPPPMPRERQIERGLSPAEVEEANEIMARVGAATRYRPDGARYEVETSKGSERIDRGPLRKPTRADYIALGVDPDVLDTIDHG